MVAKVHPSVEELAAFTLGTLGDETHASIEVHVAACTSCQERAAVAPGDRLVELLRCVHARTGRGADTMSELAAQVQTPPPLAAVADRVAPAPAESDRSEVADAVPPELARHERYRVVRLLGAGGMGAVYEAEHRVMQRTVALKIIKRVYTANAAARERFRREVRAAARLSHPNIVITYDAEDAGETHFLVMEYVEGSDLGRLVREHGPFPVDRACEYARQAALGLQYAFEQGMVHRDLKPHNLMRTPDGRVKILDFGLARFASEAASAAGLTSTGMVLGTVDYIAPEQADNAHQADIRSDIYSLGCTLYHLLAGQPPFPKGTPLQKVMAHMEKKPQPLTELRDDLPEELMPVLERMMAKDPKHRYQKPAEVALALEPFVRATAMVRAPKLRPRTRTTDPSRTVLLEKTPVRDRMWRRFVIATSILTFLVAGLLGVAIFRIATDNGELVIHTENEDVEVVVSKGGKVVKIIDTKSGKHVTLNSGEYELALKDDKEELRLSPVKMTVKRGETVLATIERVTDSGLIKNGGFEAGLEGWDTWSHGPPSQFDFDRDVVREGRQSLRVTASDPADCGCHQGVELKPRQWYRFSGWVRTRGLKVHGEARAWGTVIIYRQQGAGWPVLAKGENHSGDTEWTRISLRFQAPDEGKATISISPASFGRITGTAWFDGLKLVEESQPAEEVGEVRKFLGHTGDAYCIACSRDGRYAVSGSGWPSEDHTIRLWDITTGKQIRQFNAHYGQVFCVDFSPDGRRILYGAADNTAVLLDVATGKEVWRYVGGVRQKAVYGVTFSPNGRQVLLACEVGTARVLDAGTGKELCKFEGHRDRVMGAAFSPDGKRAVSGAMDDTIYLWDVETGEKVQSFEGHKGGVHSVAISPDGRFVLSGSENDKTLRLWEVATGKLVREFTGHEGSLSKVAFSHDGCRAISGGSDKMVRLWDVATGKELHCFTGHTDVVWGVAFSPDDRYALSASRDKTLRLWRLPAPPPAKENP